MTAMNVTKTPSPAEPLARPAWNRPVTRPDLPNRRQVTPETIGTISVS